MATVVNFIDTTLQAAAARTVNLPSAQILLTPSAPAFHIAADGTITPASITFTATLIDLDAPVVFNAAGGSLTGLTGHSATLAGADMPGTSATVIASVTVNGKAYTAPCTIAKIRDAQAGAPGADGLQVATVRLYQWAPTPPASPKGGSMLTWAGASNGAYTGSDGWSVTVPDNPGTPGWRLYVAAVTVSATARTATTAVGYAGAAVEAWSQNGAAGASGVQSGAATVYQWAATIPAGPAGTGALKWADGALDTAPGGWTLVPGPAPVAGMTLWAARVQVTDSAVAASTAFNWSAAAIMAIGYAGTNGGSGLQGASYVTAYIASSVIAANGAPAQTTGRTSLPEANSSGLAGAWSAAVPALADGQRMYQSDGIYDPATDRVTWSIPYWSSLKVGTLSAITANLGAINAGSINLGNGTFTVDNAGNLVCRSIKIVDPATGETVLQAGGPLNAKYAAPGTLNSDIAVGGRNLAEDSAFERRLRPWSQRSSWVSSIGIEGGPGAYNLLMEAYNGGDAYVDGQGPYIPVVPGKQYMLSYEYSTGTSGSIESSSSYFYLNTGVAVFWGDGFYHTDGVRVRLSKPWTCPAGVTGISPRFGIRCTGYAWMRVYNFDVQEANKAAPWSPAPEDLMADAQAKADAAANAATSAATTYAKAQADLAKANAQAYADGKVTAEEQRAINDAAAKAEAARVAAVNAAAADATAKAAVAATMADWAKVNGRPADETIKNNLIDLSWWQRLGNSPWPANGEYNVLANSLSDYGVPGPKGTDDVVWVAVEKGWNQNNDGYGQGGGWNAQQFYLDKTKTYRFVIPIRRVSGGGTSYWGTHGVATLNTTDLSPNDNPYFAQAGLPIDGWYLFVGYIYPAGSTGNSHDSAGIWSCKTGQKIAAGSNYCFMPDGRAVDHRAYQYYTQQVEATQMFGRPMINLVDGTEPSLREFLEAGAVLNNSITIGADGALNGAGGGKVTLPGMGQNTYRICAIGNTASASPSMPLGLSKDGTLVFGVGRSYMLVAINRVTGAITHTQTYDVYGNGESGGRNSATLAGDLNWFADRPGQYVIVLYTHDEPASRRGDNGLPAAMYRNGASRAVFMSSQFQGWSAYALIAISGCGEGNGAEAYQGAYSQDPNAWIDVSFTMVGGDITSVNANYQPKTLQDFGYTGSMEATNGATIGVNLGGQFNSGNVPSLFVPGAITDTQIGGNLRSSNWNGSTGAGGVGWLLERATGNLYCNNIRTRGAVMGGDFYDYAWPEGKDGNGNWLGGYYMDHRGLLLGNARGNSYIQIESNGNFRSPWINCIGGQVSVNGGLSALSATIGLFRTANWGGRTEIADNVTRVYDENNTLRVKIGNLSL